MGEIYFAGGCFWGMEHVFQKINGVCRTECGYANGKEEILPNYERVCQGDTGYRETVKVSYDPEKVTLKQLLTVFFYVIDPTVKQRQGNDIGDQYQTGIYYINAEDGRSILRFIEKERKKYPVFAVEIKPLSVFVPAEDYHQSYLIKNPQGYCHISRQMIEEIPAVVEAAREHYVKPDPEALRKQLTPVQYEVTQHGMTEQPFTGEYWQNDRKGIYVDVTTGQPLFSSKDKYESSCGWPSFCAPIEEEPIVYRVDRSFNMIRTEVRSRAGDAHLGHVFYGEPESPNGVRYCINSASLRFVPYDEMEEQGYGEWMDELNKAED